MKKFSFPIGCSFVSRIQRWSFVLACLVMLASSCSPKIPVQSVTLMQQISDEGTRMHKINIAFVGKAFDEKTEEINDFIKNVYTPDLIDGIKAQLVGQKVDWEKEWPTLLAKLMPQITATGDSLKKALNDNRVKIVTKLNDDYAVYKEACETQVSLLSSAVKLNETSRSILDTLTKKISNNKIDADKLEAALDKFLAKGSTTAEKILSLNDDINKIF
jgi:hypothetical protein